MFITDKKLNGCASIVNPLTTPYISFDKFAGLDWMRAGFSTRLGGVSEGDFESLNLSLGRGDSYENVIENFNRLGASAGFTANRVVLPNQLHTTEVRLVTAEDCGCGINTPRPEYAIDGQVTNESGVVLIVYGADCVPVFICDPVNRAVGVCHAGWRGTLGNIPKRTVELMQRSFGSRPENLIAVIGPSICKDCYEVSADVAEQFIERFKQEKIDSKNLKLIEKITVAGQNKNLYSDNASGNKNDKYLLNLWEINRQNLLLSGLRAENTAVSGVCTRCHPELLFSHRFHGDRRGTNAGFIYIK